jgi:hypothetical protein
MANPDISKTLYRNPLRSASFKTIIPVGLTLVLFILSAFLLFIPSIEKHMLTQKREMIRNLTDTTWSLLTVYHERVHRMVPKISYVKGFKPWGWIIGTGIYVEDVRADIASITYKMLLISSGILAAALSQKIREVLANAQRVKNDR